MSTEKNETLSSLKLENQRLRKQIEEKEAEAMELSKKLLNVQWNIKKSEFIAFYEEQERDRERGIMQELRDKIHHAEESWSGLDKHLKESKQTLNKLIAEKESNTLELHELRETNSKNKAKHFEINRTVCMLKNRNAAMKLKLKKQIQEFENQIQNLSSNL